MLLIALTRFSVCTVMRLHVVARLLRLPVYAVARLCGSTVIRLMRLGVSSLECCPHEHSFFFRARVFQCIFLSLLGTSSVRNGQALVQLYLSSCDEILPVRDGFCVTLEFRLPAAT